MLIVDAAGMCVNLLGIYVLRCLGKSLNVKAAYLEVMSDVLGFQVIQRGETNWQFYFICPAPLAQAMEIEKGESIEWVVVDKQTLMIRRVGQQEVITEKTFKKVKGRKPAQHER